MSWQNAAYVVDLLFWAHRAWHAVPPDTRTPAGKQANMIHGVAGMLVKLLATKDPHWLVFAADVGGTTWRHELYPAYKADRTPHPEGFDDQLVQVARLLELHRIPVVGVPGFEADDVAATLTDRFRRAGLRVVLITADKDLNQLVTKEEPFVAIWDGRERRVNTRVVLEDFGVEPARMGDLLALMGDASDGVPGLRGIGKKTAAALLEGTTDLEDMLRLKMWSRNKVGRTLREGEHDLRLWRKLVTLRADVPLDVPLGECAVGGYDTEGLRAFYEDVGLPLLASRLRPGDEKWAVPADMEALWQR